MPRPVCLDCSVEMTVHRTGLVVQFNALASSHPSGAYQQWHADTVKCASCGAEVITRYAEKPFWEHFHRGVAPETADIVVDDPIVQRKQTAKTNDMKSRKPTRTLESDLIEDR